MIPVHRHFLEGNGAPGPDAKVSTPCGAQCVSQLSILTFRQLPPSFHIKIYHAAPLGYDIEIAG